MQDLRSGSSAFALYSAVCGIGDGLGASPSSASISLRSRSLMGMFGSRSYALRYQGQHAVGRLRASPGLRDRPVDCPRTFGLHVAWAVGPRIKQRSAVRVEQAPRPVLMDRAETASAVAPALAVRVVEQKRSTKRVKCYWPTITRP